MQATLTPNGNTDKSKKIDLNVTPVSATQRRKEAFKNLGLFFFLALLFIPVPGLHFVLPAVFVIVGIAKAKKSLRSDYYLNACDLTCPECSAKLSIKPRYLEQEFIVDCTNCRNQIRIELNT